MSIQARMSQSDNRLYNPSRDVAHNFKYVVEAVAERLETSRWRELSECLTTPNKVSDEEMGQACVAFVRFVGSAVEEPNEDMGQLMLRCGWFDLKPAAQVAFMAYLGTVISGVYFTGARESTIKEEGVVTTGPCMDVQALVAAGARCSKLLTMSPLRRKLYKAGLRIKGIFHAIRGKN